MQRRNFLKTSASVVGLVLAPASVTALAANAELNTSKLTRRISKQALKDLSISFPEMTMTSPSGQDVTFELNPVAARYYPNGLFVLFEHTDEIYIYDQIGQVLGSIPLNLKYGIIKDFAVDEDNQLVFLVTGPGTIKVIGFDGGHYGDVGSQGLNHFEQLNGIKSITLDDSGRLHVLCSQSNSIKVFDNSGTLLYSYSAKSLLSKPTLHQLDGQSEIKVVGGQFKDREWFFAPSGQPIG